MNAQRLTLITAAILAVLAIVAIIWFRNSSTPTEISTTPAQTVEFSLEGQPALGDPNAPVKMALFEDFKCPACKNFEALVWPKIEKDYINTGKVQAHFVYFQIINGSTDAGIAGECAYDQSEKLFWDYKTVLYRSQGDERTNWATPDRLAEIAKEFVPDLDAEALKTCITEKRFADRVQQDRDMGISAGVQGTPSIFINGQKLEVSAQSYEEYYDQLKAALEAALPSQ
jgi:protein-disulfide isomerase